MSARPLYVVTLRAEPGVADPMAEVGRLLRYALRVCGLRCVSIRAEPPLLKDATKGGITRVTAHDREYGQ